MYITATMYVNAYMVAFSSTVNDFDIVLLTTTVMKCNKRKGKASYQLQLSDPMLGNAWEPLCW